ncbi:MAG: hypothetical protein HC915_03485 [Anaerolineae bacterium]|nr:hypothetical protein [Anaerolineae bacterium]
MKKLQTWFWVGVLLSFGLGCLPNSNADEVVVPTRADPEGARTAIVRTQNAPPPGFESIAFNPIDFNKDELPGWYAEVTVNFEGQYTATGSPTTDALKMEVWENGLRRTRRVILQFVGEALSAGITRVEAVRVGDDFYLLDSTGVCTQNSSAAQQIATLSVGSVVGGVTLALPTGTQAEVNGYDAWQYGFGAENLAINIFAQPPSQVQIEGGEVWVWPEFRVVPRFGAALQVHNALILFGEQPVTGRLRYQFNLYEVYYGQDDQPNISLPNGC